MKGGGCARSCPPNTPSDQPAITHSRKKRPRSIISLDTPNDRVYLRAPAAGNAPAMAILPDRLIGKTTGSGPVNLGSNPSPGILWRVRLAVRTPASHAGSTGSIPVRATEKGADRKVSALFPFSMFCPHIVPSLCSAYRSCPCPRFLHRTSLEERAALRTDLRHTIARSRACFPS